MFKVTHIMGFSRTNSGMKNFHPTNLFPAVEPVSTVPNLKKNSTKLVWL